VIARQCRAAADGDAKLAEIDGGEIRRVDERVEQRIDAGHRRDLAVADNANEPVQVARIGNEEIQPAEDREAQQVRGQRKDMIERQRREHPLAFHLQPRSDPGNTL
jgi:hypothetical protein